jgi:phosphoglycerol transferase MdoB-like AlkP superfamily enzyme
VNATALRFMENPMISAYMVWQTYPVITGGIIMLSVIAASIFALVKITGLISDNESARRFWPSKAWYSKTLLVFMTVVLVLAGAMSKRPDSLASWYPLRWSDAFFSTHAFSTQLASNPVIYFSNTLKNVAETYDLEQTRAAYPAMVDYLHIPQPDAETLNFARPVRFDSHYEAPFNVVVIILESFASYKSSVSGNPLDTTPNIKFLADNGYYFKNFFTPSTGTARSVWTFTTGIPDIEKNKTSSRNPLIVDQHTIINAFKGYEKLYFLGGSASWANIRGLLSSNIPGLKLYEEGSYESPDIDVWGISDLDLFREANKVLRHEKRPFFAVIQTSGNHRPYTIPEDNAGFERLTADDLPSDVENYGFHSVEELNSYRFMDHSLGEFLRLAKHEGYFDNTLFVLFGDHGIHAPTGHHVPAYESQLRLQGLRVPLVFYNQELITKPETFTRIASETDVLPTIAALTRTDHVNTTLGRDLLDTSLDTQRYAFTIEHGTDRTIGLLSEDYYLVMQSDGSKLRLHDLNSADPRQDSKQQKPDVSSSMQTMLNAIWQSIRYIRENNKPRKQPNS